MKWKQIITVLALLVGGIGLWYLRHYFNQPFASIGWQISLFFYACVFCITASIAYGLLLFAKANHITKLNAALLLISLFSVLLIAEFGLRITGINRAYIETRGGKYSSAYVKHDTNIHRTYGPGTTTFVQSNEFKFPRHHNNLGFSDADFFPKTDSSKILIQTYGDSFTEGDGAPVDSSYPAIMKTLLAADKQPNLQIQNFGICGNDPGFYWIQLKDIGSSLKPDVAVITYTTGDFTTDYFTHGGLERFKNGYYQGFKGPSWEWVYGSSYIFRVFINSIWHISFNNFFLNEEDRAQRLKELQPKWNDTFLKIAKLASEHHIKILLIKKPERSEVDRNNYEYDFSFFEKMADTIPQIKRYDLLSYYRDSAHISNSNSINYYWPKDGHHNATGYSIMAKAVYAGLRQSYPEIFTTLDSLKTK